MYYNTPRHLDLWIPDASGFVLCMLFSEMCHNVQNILFDFIGIIFKLICKFKIGYSVIVINFKIRSYDFVILRQKNILSFYCSSWQPLLWYGSSYLHRKQCSYVSPCPPAVDSSSLYSWGRNTSVRRCEP